VSLALSDPTSTRVSAEVRARIVQIAQELGYRPQRAGRELRLGTTDLLLLAVPDVRSTFFARVLHGAQRAADRAGAAVVLGSGWSGDDLTEAVADGRFGGVILCSPTDEILRSEVRGVPVVLLDADPRAVEPLAMTSTGTTTGVIQLDVAAGMHQLVAHVRAQGHERVGRVESTIRSYTFRARQTAFDVAGRGLDVVRERVDLAEGVAASAAAAGRLLDLPRPPTAIICDDDVIAAGVYHAARSRGLSIPDDVSVLGMDDAPAAQLMDPPLTTIAFPAEALGAAGVHHVLSGRERHDLAVPSLPAPSLIVRGSVVRRSGRDA